MSRGFNDTKSHEWRSEVSKQNSYDYFLKQAKCTDNKTKQARTNFNAPAYKARGREEGNVTGNKQQDNRG